MDYIWTCRIRNEQSRVSPPLTADADVLCRDVGPLPLAGGPAHLAEVVVGGAVGGADGPHRALAPLGARARRDALPRRRAEPARPLPAAQRGARVQACRDGIIMTYFNGLFRGCQSRCLGLSTTPRTKPNGSREVFHAT